MVEARRRKAVITDRGHDGRGLMLSEGYARRAAVQGKSSREIRVCLRHE